MDLYEALKAGTSAEELLDKFYKELDEASARIVSEQKKLKEEEDNKQWLAECRGDLVDAVASYIEALMPVYFGNEDFYVDEESYKAIKEGFLDFETGLTDTSQIINKLYNMILKDDTSSKNAETKANTTTKQEQNKDKENTRTFDNNKTYKIKLDNYKDDDIITNFLKSLRY